MREVRKKFIREDETIAVEGLRSIVGEKGRIFAAYELNIKASR